MVLSKMFLMNLKFTISIVILKVGTQSLRRQKNICVMHNFSRVYINKYQVYFTQILPNTLHYNHDTNTCYNIMFVKPQYLVFTFEN